MSSTASDAINTNGINAIVPSTGAISIGASQTDGILNLGAGASRTTTGVINIGNTASLNQINIDTASILNSNANPAISIGASSSTKTIKIGSNTNSVHCSSIDLQGSSINNITGTTGVISIGNLQTAGVLNIGGTSAIRAVGADVNIATGASNACAINVMNGGALVSGSVNIANVGANTTAINIGSRTGTGTVTIGGASSNTNIIGDLKVVGNFLNNSSDESGGAIYIAGKQTTGILWIGSGDASRSSGAINIGGGTCPINIMNRPGFSLGGSVNIANGTGAGQSTAVNIGSGSTTGLTTIGNLANTTSILSGTVNLKSGVGTSLIPLAGSVNIATGTGATFVSTATNIGTGDTTGTVTIGGASNTVQVNGALTMGTGRNITLQPTASYVLPTTGQLGSSATIIVPIGGGNSTTANTPLVSRSASLTAGVWILTGNAGMGTSGISAFLSISATSATDNDAIASNTATGNFLHISRIVFLTATTTYNLIALTQLSATLNNVTFTAVRIA